MVMERDSPKSRFKIKNAKLIRKIRVNKIMIMWQRQKKYRLIDHSSSIH